MSNLLVKKFVRDFIPPIIFTSGFYSRLLNAKRVFGSEKSIPVKVTSGDLAGYTLKLNPHGAWQHEMISGIYDHELFSQIKSLNLTDKVIYDIGAHIGYHSLAFAVISGSNGRVFAFEPNPANVTRANEIIDLNPSLKNRITILNRALSDHSGNTSFLSTEDVEGGTSTGGFIDDASTLWERNRYVNKVGFKKTEVQIDTIDELVSTKQTLPPDMLKIDVEGAEQLVLAGAKQTINTYHPIIIVEFHSIYSAYSCMEILKQHNYTTELLKREPDGRVMIIANYIK